MHPPIHRWRHTSLQLKLFGLGWFGKHTPIQVGVHHCIYAGTLVWFNFYLEIKYTMDAFRIEVVQLGFNIFSFQDLKLTF